MLSQGNQEPPFSALPSSPGAKHKEALLATLPMRRPQAGGRTGEWKQMPHPPPAGQGVVSPPAPICELHPSTQPPFFFPSTFPSLIGHYWVRGCSFQIPKSQGDWQRMEDS